MANLIDVILEGGKQIVAWITRELMEGVTSGYRTLNEAMFGTPTPQTSGAFIFGQATNAPWKTIQNAVVGGEVMLISLFLLVMSVQGRHTLRIFNVGSAYDAHKTKKNAWVGALLIITWYWLGATTLYLVDGFTIALMPDLSVVTKAMGQFLLNVVTNPILALFLALIGGISMWALEALLYLRRILLYVYLYGMPIAFALGYGNVPVISDAAMGFTKRFVPLAILPIPAAIVFKGYDLLFSGGTISPATVFLKNIVAVSLPLLALFVTWRTFRYATPLSAKLIGGATKGVVLIGTVAAGAYAGGSTVATTAARWGPKAAVGQAVAQKAASRGQESTDEDSAPDYRRTENDPGGSTADPGTEDRGMDFDRGIH